MKNILVLAMCMVLSGCAFSHKTHRSNQGSEVSADQVALIQPGATDKDWILRTLGTPDRIHADAGGLEVFEYVTRTHRKVDSHFILIFSVETERVIETSVTRIVLREGIVESVDMTET